MFSPIWGFVTVGIALATAAALTRYSAYFAQISKPSGSRFPQIDGLRGYLAVGVFVTHAASIPNWFDKGEWEWTPSVFYHMAGTVPVSLFFMITALLFWCKAINGRILFVPLLKSRLHRLAPLYLFAIIPLLLIVGQRTGWELRTDIGSLLTTVIGWAALGLGGRPDINGLAKTWVINTPVWTLWYEWAFYLSLPVLSLFSGIRGTLAIGVSVVTFCIYNGNEFILLNFVVGALVAHLVGNLPDLGFMRSKLATLVALLFVALIAVLHLHDYGPWHTLLLTPIFVVIAYGNTIFGVLSMAPAKILGAISYSIYLLHCLILQAVMQTVNLAFPLIRMSALEYWLVTGIVCAAVVITSSITFRFIEHPWMKFDGQTSKLRVQPN